MHGIIVPEAGWIRAGITVPAVGRTKVGITALEVGLTRAGITVLADGLITDGATVPEAGGDSGGGGTGCFITTACVEHQGLPDDCAELQTLRKYRDVLVQEDDDFRSKVLEYYRKAPLIIQEIEKNWRECCDL